jgi:L-amino acid N-acyltransferase
MQVRDATSHDLPGILAIYNDIIATTTAVYAIAPSTLEERATWFETRRQQGFPVLVATDASGVAGFSSFGEWRGAWPGYAHTVEHSIHVRADTRGLGVGRGLVEALFPRALAMGKHVMIGGVDASNTASLRFHQKLGFAEVARFHEVGFKFGRWLDLVFLQRFLDAPGTPRV